MDFYKSKFKNNKNIKDKNWLFLNRYLKFISFYMKTDIKNNFEKHHILPKSEYPEFKNEEWNIIKLPYRAHFLAHWMLAKALDGKMWYAFYAMCNKNRKSKKINSVNSRLYEKAKSKFREKHSEWHNTETDGILNKNIVGQKTKQTKLQQDGYYREISKRSAETMKTTLLDNGLTIAQQRALDAAKTIRETGVLKGKNNYRSRVIQVFNNKEQLIKTYNGDFFLGSKKDGLPTRALKKSYNEEGSRIYQSKFGKSTAKRLGFEKFIGWYAIDKCCSKELK